MTRILAISGSKQSGKSTMCNFIHGYQMRCFEVIKDFVITKQGELFVNAGVKEDGTKEDGFAKLDISRTDDEFRHWAEYHMFPIVKKYSFADELKRICVELFDIPPECCYGTDEQKNQIQEHLRWENMPRFQNMKLMLKMPIDARKSWDWREGPMTARQFMQFFGTDVMRKIYEPIWINKTITRIKQEMPLVAVVDDMRFYDEFLALNQSFEDNILSVGLTRKVKADNHSSENVESVINACDLLIDNNNNKMTIDEVNQEIISQMDNRGWLGEEVSKPKKTPLHQIRK